MGFEGSEELYAHLNEQLPLLLEAGIPGVDIDEETIVGHVGVGFENHIDTCVLSATDNRSPFTSLNLTNQLLQLRPTHTSIHLIPGHLIKIEFMLDRVLLLNAVVHYTSNELSIVLLLYLRQ